MTVATFDTTDLWVAGFLVAFAGAIVYMLVRFVVRIRNDDVEVAHRWSDQVTGGPPEQTPEEAVAEWERRRRERPWASRHRRLLAAAGLFLAACIAFAAYLYLHDSKTRPSHCAPPLCNRQ